MRKYLFFALLLPVLLATGCSADEPDLVPLSPEVQKGSALPGQEISSETVDDLTVAWLVGGKVAVISNGSSTCPLVVVGTDGEPPAHVFLEVETTEANCSADLAPTTSVFPAPSGWETPSSFTVDYSDERVIISLEETR